MAKTIFGLLGYPVKHSLSAFMHNAAFAACGIDAEYRLFEIKPVELKKFLLDGESLFSDTLGNEVKSREVIGFNITIPHKVAAKDILEDHFSNFQTDGQYFVKLAGALNTVKREERYLQYRNTDVTGFLRSIKEDLKFDPKNKTVLVLGCGGAGRAVIAGLVSKETAVKRVYVFENDELTARSVAAHFEELANKIIFIGKDNLESASLDSQLLINATPVGMHDNDPDVIDEQFLHKDLNVYDVIYNRTTRLIENARKKNLPASGGLGMLLYQGVIAWEFWTNKTAPVDIMRKALIGAMEP